MNYYVERILQAIGTYVAAVTFAFVMYRLMPGGPVERIQAQLIQQRIDEGQTVDIEEINRIARSQTGIDPDQSIPAAYIEYVSRVILEQDFGESIQYSEPVFDILFSAMPWSIFISVHGLLLGFSTAILLGSFMAFSEGSRFDTGSTVLVIVMSSIPYYVGALILLGIFAFQWGIFPTGGRMPQGVQPGFSIPFALGVAHHAALPILSGFIIGFGGGALGMRANAIRVIGSEYIYAGRLRGVRKTRLMTRYVARNAVLPLYMRLMIGIAAIFSSSIILEQIFAYPGVGWYTFDALVVRDYPLLMGAFIFFTAITIAGILFADFTYGLIDPRAGTGAEREEF